MYAESIDFPLAGGEFSQTTRELGVSSSHSLKAGSDNIHWQVPGIQRRWKKAKSSSGVCLLAKSCSTSSTSSDDWLFSASVPTVGKRVSMNRRNILSF